MGNLIDLRGIDERAETRTLQAKRDVNHSLATLEAIIGSTANSELRKRAHTALATVRAVLDR